MWCVSVIFKKCRWDAEEVKNHTDVCARRTRYLDSGVGGGGIRESARGVVGVVGRL